MIDFDSNSQRPIDRNVAAARQAMRSRFSYVTKARANIWLTTGVTLFVFGLFSAVFLINRQGGDVGADAAGLRDRYLDRASAPEGAAGIKGPGEVGAGEVNAYVFTAPSGTTARDFVVDWGDGSPAETLSAHPSTFIATGQHAYAQVGTFMVTATIGTVAPATLTVKVGSAQADPTPDQEVSVALDPSTPPAHTVQPGAANETFTIIKITTLSEVTIRSIQVIANGTASRKIGPVKVYAGTTLLGSGNFEQASTTANVTARISLGAGLTIPADSAVMLTLKADVLEGAAAGEIKLGVFDISTQPASTIQATLPIYGNAVTIQGAKTGGGREIQIDGGPAKNP